MAKNKTRMNKATLMKTGAIAAMMTVATIVFVIGFLVSRQLFGDIRFNTKVISRKNTANATLGHNVEQLPDLVGNFDDLETTGPQVDEVLNALPLDAVYEDFSAQLETMASLAGARLSAVTLAAQPLVAADGSSTEAVTAGPQQSPQTVQFRISAVGTYESLQKLTKNMEVSVRPITIVSIQLNGSDPDLAAEYIVTTHYQGITTVESQKEIIQQ